MRRWLPLGLVVVLLGATAVAFGRTEGLKLESNPISGPVIDATFSPVCGCPQRVMHLAFRLRTTGKLTVAVVTPDDRLVRTLIDGRRVRRNRLHLTWNGRTDSGAIAPDGPYSIRVSLAGHRNVILPKGTTVDTVPPQLDVLGIGPAVISPDGDHVHDSVVARYRLNEHAHVRLLVNGHVRVRGRYARLTGSLAWSGTAGGRTLPAGTYRISLVAQDLAGNVSAPSPAVAIRIRFVSLAERVVHARVGTRFSVEVLTDARSVRWQFLGRSGTTKPGPLVLEATKAGRHVLVVEANGHTTRAMIAVTAK